ncbi:MULTISPECIES: calcium/sodium antiporter [Roseivirga]|jgi:cation:H+ antiporter|uniref:Sodium:calcium antiporter n=1 Tax=Roseivirga thermotolerans TaxID=1758176 RepID=A0ABQ3I3D2_9BACT|nr:MULTISPECIES: calcium/sodium antiporter [Roseivirga]MEC7753027.1 calcium/sodium antiporter [Bacteroidota bacterium]GHE52460.1 sodium:calcium antiporter [Roseivirga thermotolerans]|tara:strand:- start:569 stop:1507 length:939 start_codon:yes stop_codon:yes gene_type:complete
MLLDIIVLVLGLVLLIAGGDFLVKGASRIALRFNVSAMVIGLTIVAFSTSAPELLVSLNAALKEAPDFAMGNVVGSNISNLALVLGVACLFGYIPIHRGTATRDWLTTMVASILLYLFVLDQKLTSWEGGILFGCLVIYLIVLLIKTKKDQVKLDYTIEPDKDTTFEKFKDLLLLAIGGACLYFGSNWFIDGAADIATDLGVSQRIIGLTILAIGTSLPELFTSVIAAKKGETDLALGNLLGSNIFNILSILGITSMIHPLDVNQIIISSDMLWMLAISLGILPLMLLRKRLGTPSGIILLLFYVTYLVTIL